MSSNLIDYINNKTEGKYYFLKLSEVVYSKKDKKCFVSFIYPQTVKDLTDEEKAKIVKLTNDFLAINSAVEVRIKKSYMDENLIYRACIRYFEENAKSIADNFNSSTLFVSVEEQVATIDIVTNRHVSSYMAQKDVKIALIAYLNLNFCGSFIVNIKEEIEDIDDSEFLQERQKRIEEISYATSYINNQNRRFTVLDIKPIIGDEIGIMPEHIVDGEADNRVFAGKIKYLTLRTFKKAKKQKDGTEIVEDKPYFTFVLQDKNKQMNMTHFPTKANVHKMNLLSDGMSVLVKGDVKLFREKFSMSVKAISLCSIEGEEHVSTGFKKSVSRYMFISPEPYVRATQDDLFGGSSVNEGEDIPEAAKGKTFVVFDLETTGLLPTEDEIIEIGAVKIVDGKLKETFACFVKPSRPIPEEATKINNITNDMVAGAYSINQVFPDFYKFCEGAVMVGHNAIDFDFKFVDHIAKQMGYKMNHERMDTILMSRSKLSHLRAHNLKAISAYLGVELIDAHRAVNDTIATAQVFLKLL